MWSWIWLVAGLSILDIPECKIWLLWHCHASKSKVKEQWWVDGKIHTAVNHYTVKLVYGRYHFPTSKSMTTESMTLNSPSIRLCSVSTSYSVKNNGTYPKIMMSRIIIVVIVPILDVLIISHVSLITSEDGSVNPEERRGVKTDLELGDKNKL